MEEIEVDKFEPDENGAYKTGNLEADRIINRLMSSDPDFDDCTDAAALVFKLVTELKGPDDFKTWKEAAIAERLNGVEHIKTTIYYSINNDNERYSRDMSRLPGYLREFELTSRECAEDYWSNHGGNKCNWPLFIYLFETKDGPEIARCEVYFQMEPFFYPRLRSTVEQETQ